MCRLLLNQISIQLLFCLMTEKITLTTSLWMWLDEFDSRPVYCLSQFVMQCKLMQASLSPSYNKRVMISRIYIAHDTWNFFQITLCLIIRLVQFWEKFQLAHLTPHQPLSFICNSRLSAVNLHRLTQLRVPSKMLLLCKTYFGMTSTLSCFRHYFEACSWIGWL